jgi:hypothetical protein
MSGYRSSQEGRYRLQVLTATLGKTLLTDLSPIEPDAQAPWPLFSFPESRVSRPLCFSLFFLSLLQLPTMLYSLLATAVLLLTTAQALPTSIEERASELFLPHCSLCGQRC